MAQVALHGQNYGKGSVAKLQRHNKRENEKYSNQEIDLTKTPNNYVLQEKQGSYYKAIMNRVEQRTNNSRAIRSDANVLTEFVFSSSHEYMTSLSQDKLRELFEAVDNFLSSRFGKENVIYSVVHVDEHTPHLHFGFVPMTPEGKLSAKAVMTRSTLKSLQSDLPKHLSTLGFNLARGTENSKAKHLEPLEYKHQAEQVKQALMSEIMPLVDIKASSSHINAIQPKKTLTGGVKGITVEQIEKLKEQAKALSVANLKIKKLEKQLSQVDNQQNVIDKLTEQNKKLYSTLIRKQQELDKKTIELADKNEIIECLLQAKQSLPKQAQIAFSNNFEELAYQSRNKTR